MIGDTTNDITLTPAAYTRINQMINFKPKHFTKLAYGHVGLKELCKLFPEHKSIYVRAKLEILFWLRFEKDEINEFDLLVKDVVNAKLSNQDAKLSELVNLSNIN